MRPGAPSILPEKDKKKKSNKKILLLRDSFSFLFKSAGLILWFVVFLLALLEIKRYYNIDVIPGYDSSVDDVYGAARGTLSELFGE
tara:strand:- start:840 stop:1097 length:258 start_codon:yes stop_codon:yes gene_type:complete